MQISIYYLIFLCHLKALTSSSPPPRAQEPGYSCLPSEIIRSSCNACSAECGVLAIPGGFASEALYTSKLIGADAVYLEATFQIVGNVTPTSQFEMAISGQSLVVPVGAIAIQPLSQNGCNTEVWIGKGYTLLYSIPFDLRVFSTDEVRIHLLELKVMPSVQDNNANKLPTEQLNNPKQLSRMNVTLTDVGFTLSRTATLGKTSTPPIVDATCPISFSPVQMQDGFWQVELCPSGCVKLSREESRAYVTISLIVNGSGRGTLTFEEEEGYIQKIYDVNTRTLSRSPCNGNWFNVSFIYEVSGDSVSQGWNDFVRRAVIRVLENDTDLSFSVVKFSISSAEDLKYKPNAFHESYACKCMPITTLISLYTTSRGIQVNPLYCSSSPSDYLFAALEFKFSTGSTQETVTRKLEGYGVFTTITMLISLVGDWQLGDMVELWVNGVRRWFISIPHLRTSDFSIYKASCTAQRANSFRVQFFQPGNAPIEMTLVASLKPTATGSRSILLHKSTIRYNNLRTNCQDIHTQNTIQAPPNSQRHMALGVGLGVGLLLCILLMLSIAYYLWKQKKQKRTIDTCSVRPAASNITPENTSELAAFYMQRNQILDDSLSIYDKGTRKQYRVSQKVLGKGAFGIVHLGVCVDDGSLVAVKTLVGAVPQLEGEFAMLSSLTHPNIVRLLTFHKNGHHEIQAVMEYVAGGTLESTIQKFGRLSKSMVSRYFKEALQGLLYLHEHGVVHRDIKPMNMLLTSDGVVKLADFGLSRESGATTRTANISGTVEYMSPEAADGRITAKSDVWSIGLCILNAVTGRTDWCSGGYAAYLVRLLTGGVNIEIPDDDEEVAAVIRACLAEESERLTAAELLAMPLFMSRG